MCPRGQGAQERLPRAGTTAGWSGPLRVEAGPPGGLCAWAGLGGPDLPSHLGGGPVPPRAPVEAAAKPALPRVRWQPAFCGKPAQLPH
jgi:hypothetical protein